ncbi:tRNA pseudouridine(38-40) synthase TruA [Flavimaricola marinus]|uniref:tRNA pseudouridine synthase A n=1 Tax=Flavimaricola marinus TaxID=1819565 RepID=A0A238LCG9_9RHOB|nr:tRNA pseudouridine(38-40) synthase TruA [Flavimaricola marinus]SMY06636.1 tRNA pseudouridine synthase A [Flavimaricola marinus]
MPRYALRIEYHGAPFAGWQRQTDVPSAQAAVEAALGRLEPKEHRIAAAGRTDAGVHATGQVAHCDLEKVWEPFRLMEAVNYHLKPDPVAVTGCAIVPDDWHARFSAQERRYLFRIISRRPTLVHDAGLAWHHKSPLDIEAMQAGANRLLGKHDFTTFRSTMCQANSPVKTLDEASVTGFAVLGGQEVQLRFRARSFLHNQVRSFVGTLAKVGTGAWSPEDVSAALEARDRAACGPVCPPEGLYLTGVGYPYDPFAEMDSGGLIQ